MTKELTASQGSRAAENDLQASSDMFLAAVGRLEELERAKRDMPTHGEGRELLAREIEEIVLDLVARGRYQTRLIELQEQAADGQEASRRPSIVLEEWRTAERRLHEARMELEHASDAADRLREEHRRSFRPENGESEV